MATEDDDSETDVMEFEDSGEESPRDSPKNECVNHEMERTESGTTFYNREELHERFYDIRPLLELPVFETEKYEASTKSASARLTKYCDATMHDQLIGGLLHIRDVLEVEHASGALLDSMYPCDMELGRLLIRESVAAWRRNLRLH